MRILIVALFLFTACRAWDAPGHKYHRFEMIDSCMENGEVKYWILKCTKDHCEDRDTFPRPQFHEELKYCNCE